jgi:serpin B
VAIANGLFAQQGMSLGEDFTATLDEHYGAAPQQVDFTSGQAKEHIDAWVAEQTAGRITELFDEIPEDSVAVLANAVYLKAAWEKPFLEPATADEEFHLADGGTVAAPMMKLRSEELRHAEGDGWQAAQLPYAGGASMLLIAPDGDLADFTATLDPGTLDAIRTSLDSHAVDLRLPRLDVETATSLAAPLKALGMVTAFAPPSGSTGADFTGITAERELFIHDVVHQANLTVDEEGTEAAAATAVLIGMTSAPPPATFHLDRPFLLLIEDDQTGAILFAGQVVDPSA